MIKNEKGQALAEMALVIPLLLLLLVGIVDLGRVLYTYSSLHFTTQETVRLSGFGKTDSEVTQFARNNFSAGDSSQLKVQVSPGAAQRRPGNYVTVRLEYPVKPITPFAGRVFSGPITLRTDSTIRIE
ncbi:TadE/TadG family type IV pilus assembly protein [Evansella clarkii]|jgi:Flp pilus assembly protein TadG|uniref:TadE/TadG family type IV pilus assembly protein n=1 Tax=Evansella clarkii TaxID=79879 RepID=UPI0009985F28|nr:TadE/TadG family type IV pilus assembly protein [Evansella clarkii]